MQLDKIAGANSRPACGVKKGPSRPRSGIVIVVVIVISRRVCNFGKEKGNGQRRVQAGSRKPNKRSGFPPTLERLGQPNTQYAMYECQSLAGKSQC
jgi:hypothetical protein